MPLSAGFSPIDFLGFHREELPALMATGRERLATRAAAGHLHSIALRLPDGPAYTYRPHHGGVEIIPGDDVADTVIEMDLDSWQGLVHELEAPAGLLYARRARCRRGNPLDLMAWESALRALYNGRPPYEPGDQVLQDRDGGAIDPQATFTLAPDQQERMAHFLRTTGYLFVRGVFRADELAVFLQEAQQLQDEARRGDKLSWWGKNAAGEEVLSTRLRRPRTTPIGDA
jgi:hypothetical protein